jgi:hypothetical protein
MTIALKKKLKEMFASEESIGIQQLDFSTGETEEEFNKRGHGRPFEDIATLPNGFGMGNCGYCADYVIKALGEGYRYGFHCEDNPVSEREIEGVGGHDFAVIQGRYIVDIWISLYVGATEQVVYDMRDKADEKAITHIFGDPNKWSVYDHVNKRAYEAKDVPENLKLSLGRPSQAQGLSMS